MSVRILVAVLMLGAGAFVPASRFAATVEPAAAAAPAQTSSSLDQQTELAVTVYNSDIALVRDVREVELPAGTFDLDFADIAATINPATVHFRSLTEPSRVGVLEQNYEYDLIEPDKLLRKYVGREVTLVRLRQVDGATREEEVRARLLSYNTAPVWQINGEIVTGLHADHIRFPEMPANLHARPTLIWALSNEGARRHRVEVWYLAGQLSWSADYVLTVARNDRLADLDGWVTVRNGSGTSFRNASLQLVAGDLNRVRQEVARELDAMASRVGVAAAAPMSQESLGDYHLYSVPRKTSINTSETKQISMMGGTDVPVLKRYVVNGQSTYFRYQHTNGDPLKAPVEVFYQFKNDTVAGLGVPMPSGTIRVYQADSRGGLQFMGEDRIGHTPKDETLNLKIGHAFDVVAERRQLTFDRLSDRVFETTHEIVLRNHKTTPVTVEVNEPFGGDWRVVESTHRSTAPDARTARFNLTVPADGQVTVRYRVRVTY